MRSVLSMSEEVLVECDRVLTGVATEHSPNRLSAVLLLRARYGKDTAHDDQNARRDGRDR